MSAHNTPAELNQAPYETLDPGTGVPLQIDRWNQVIPLTIAASASETNTLAAPTQAGQKVTLFAASVGASGSRVVTVASALNAAGSLTITFDAVDDFVTLESIPVGSGVYEWRVTAIEGATGPATLTTGAGAGITGGTGTVYKNSVEVVGGIIKTSILIDLTGLESSTTDLDIIGVGASVAHLGRITAAQNGTILAIRMTCLELPVGGADDIDLYAATEGTGVFDGGIAALTETALITSGAAWASGTVKASTEVPAAGQYLYLTGGEAGTAAAYTAGKFLIELFGY